MILGFDHGEIRVAKQAILAKGNGNLAEMALVADARPGFKRGFLDGL